MKSSKDLIKFLARVGLGWIFLWAFLDKLFGLGFATEKGSAWLDGVSPTAGFLEYATHGPFVEIFQAMAGSPIVDWLFMMGLLGLGLALILGIGLRVAAFSGGLMMFMMWLSMLPPENNPFVDEHLIYILLMFGLALQEAGDVWGLGKWWKKTALVRKWKWLA